MITSLRLQNFRSHQDSSFEFSDEANIIIGPNASGKTNILEAMLFVCGQPPMKDMGIQNIQHDAGWARLDATTNTNQTRVVKFKNDDGRLKTTFEIDEQIIKRIQPSQRVPVVVFEPDNIQLITTSPEYRRNFIDGLLGQIDPEYKMQRINYSRVLSQRNRLLKNNQNARLTVFPWNIRLSELGAIIAQKRLNLTEKLNETISDTYQSIAKHNHNVAIKYSSKIDHENYATALLKELESNLEKELQRGITLFGPHRDDIQITIDNHLLHRFASRGESRTTMLALKIQETRLIEGVVGRKPLLLLDDVFGELDGARRRTLTSFISSHQSFITTTDADVVEKSYGQKAQIIKLK